MAAAEGRAVGMGKGRLTGDGPLPFLPNQAGLQIAFIFSSSTTLAPFSKQSSRHYGILLSSQPAFCIQSSRVNHNASTCRNATPNGRISSPPRVRSAAAQAHASARRFLPRNNAQEASSQARFGFHDHNIGQSNITSNSNNVLMPVHARSTAIAMSQCRMLPTARQ